jgi:valyl-tRNA synthetase
MTATRKTHLGIDEKHYIPARVEPDIYTLWEKAGVFRAQQDSQKPAFSMVIPPPNVTGRLHMGHGLNNTIQDVIARHKRMTGFDVLWLPGTDHAGISTQSVVKKHLQAEGVDWLSLGREKMVERIWTWKEQYGETILHQLRRLGSSCDWERTRFTMDTPLSKAVRTAFKRLFDKGLIYRDKYIVNWCPVDQTALSDDEVETKEGGEPGFLWYFNYPFADAEDHLTVATTRPETMLGDTAVAVHPDDERFNAHIGRELILPLVGRKIPVIGDAFVDPEFGTGCVKVTPAHDVNDFEIGKRHNLEQINVMNPDASMNDNVPEQFRNLDRFKCRAKVVEALKAQGFFLKQEERMTPIGRCQRSKAMVEYRLSDQWFVSMRPLADAALKASDDGLVAFHPQRWDGVYRDWLENTRDWCISRQLWWGHRIPAWYHRENGTMLVEIETPEIVKQNPDQWVQDEDVLDTWFSSALWPYSTMGWPEDAEDLARYFPTDVLVTAKDIIFFWVARMVMTSLFNTGKVPFYKVLINPIILDEDGETMSKSKGNGIDPLHVIDGATQDDLEGPIYEARPVDMDRRLSNLRKNFPDGFKGVGADALRYTLMTNATGTQQFQISLKRFEDIGRPLTDKIWNGSRLILEAMAMAKDLPAADTKDHLKLEDEWILGRLDKTIETVGKAYEDYAFHHTTDSLYHFFWDDLCDWYLELAKFRLREGRDTEKRALFQTLSEVMSCYLRLLHPIVPFITEELWGHFQAKTAESLILSTDRESLWGSKLCATASFPETGSRWNPDTDEAFGLLQDMVRTIRNMRSNAGIKATIPLEAVVVGGDAKLKSTLQASTGLITHSACLKALKFSADKPRNMTMAVVESLELYVNLAEHMDIEAEIVRIERELAKVDKEILSLGKKLSNKGFTEGAPAEIVAKVKNRHKSAVEKKHKLQVMLKDLPRK